MVRVSVDREAEQFTLRRNEERRLKNLADGLLDNESDDSDDESQEVENLADQNPVVSSCFPSENRKSHGVKSYQVFGCIGHE